MVRARSSTKNKDVRMKDVYAQVFYSMHTCIHILYVYMYVYLYAYIYMYVCLSHLYVYFFINVEGFFGEMCDVGHAASHVRALALCVVKLNSAQDPETLKIPKAFLGFRVRV